LSTKAFNKTYQKKKQNKRLGLWPKKRKKKTKKKGVKAGEIVTATTAILYQYPWVFSV